MPQVLEKPSPRRALVALWVLLVLAFPVDAFAKSHLWKFKEIFSNADGSVQYIEMDVLDPAGTGEWRTINQELASNGSVFIFPANLPQENTYLRSMLIATPAFAALPGAPTPDFVIPAGFFDPAGDQLRYRVSLDTFSFVPGELPVDGLLALQRSDGSTPVNSPTNFAGVTGSVDASGGVAVYGVWPPLMLAALALAGWRWVRREG